jgi:hypothetical protein
VGCAAKSLQHLVSMGGYGEEGVYFSGLEQCVQSWCKTPSEKNRLLQRKEASQGVLKQLQAEVPDKQAF